MRRILMGTVHIIPSIPLEFRANTIIKLLRNRLEFTGSTTMATPQTPDELAMIHSAREEYVLRNHTLPNNKSGVLK